MVQTRGTTSADSSLDNDHQAIIEMHATIGELCHHNQALEDNIVNLKRRHQEVEIPE